MELLEPGELLDESESFESLISLESSESDSELTVMVLLLGSPLLVDLNKQTKEQT